MNQDGNKRGPKTNRGLKPVYPELLYKYHVRRGVDDGKSKEEEERQQKYTCGQEHKAVLAG